MCTSDPIKSPPPASKIAGVTNNNNLFTSHSSRRESRRSSTNRTLETAAFVAAAAAAPPIKEHLQSSVMSNRGRKNLWSLYSSKSLFFGFCTAAVIVCQIFLILAFHSWTSVDDATSSLLFPVVPVRDEWLVPSLTWEQPARNAYAFLIAGVDPNNPSGYMGYIWNLLAAKYIFDFSGSQADVLVMIRMASNTGGNPVHHMLPGKHEEALRRAGIRIEYLPMPKQDNYFTAQMDKFHMLKLTEYDHIFFMDSDVIPMCNLDYVFDMMDRHEIAQNLVVGWGKTPAQGGFFCLSPEEGDFETIFDQYIDNYHFDIEYGFGHKIIPPDRWESPHAISNSSPKRHGRKWTFYGANADQGLLYHWTKYHKMDVTLVNHGHSSTWGRSVDENEETTVELQSRHRHLFTSCGRRTERPSSYYKFAPMSDHHHFSRNKKPFFIDPSEWYNLTLDNFEDVETSEEAWFTAFSLAKKQYKLGDLLSDVELSQKRPEPQLGIRLESNMIPSHMS